MRTWLLCACLVLVGACSCDDDGEAGLDIDGGRADASESPWAECLPYGSCLQGTPCDEVCCGFGENCVLIDEVPVCRCGEGPACEVGQSCEAVGPVGEDGCGTICCGGADPCPQ